MLLYTCHIPFSERELAEQRERELEMKRVEEEKEKERQRALSAEKLSAPPVRQQSPENVCLFCLS